MRKPAIILTFVVVIIILAVTVPRFNINSYRPKIEAQLGRELNRNVTVGDISLRLFPPQLRVENPVIADDPSFQTSAPFIKADVLDVSPRFLPMLRGNLEIDSLKLQRPTVELFKNRDGVWNFSTFGRGGTSQSGHPLSIDLLSIRNGQLAVTDLQQNQPRAIYDHIDVNLRDYAPGKVFSTDVAAHLPGPGAEQLRLQGTAGPLTNGAATTTPFDGTLNLKEVSVGSLKEFAGSPTLAKTDGIVSGETKISSGSGKFAATGHLNIANAAVNGVSMGYPITADYNLADDGSAGITINPATIKLGQTPVTVTGSINNHSTPPQLDLTVNSGDVSIAEIARLAAAFGEAVVSGTNVEGRVAVKLQARGSADRPALSGTISARDLKITGKDIKEPMTIPSVVFTMAPAEIQSNDFQMTVGSAAVAAHLAIHDYTAQSPAIDATMRAPNATLPEVLAIAKAYGVTGLDRISGGSGTLSADLRAVGPMREVSSAAIVRVLNGEVTLNLSNVRVSGTSITHELGSLAGFVKSGQANEGFTDIAHLTGHVVIKNGVAQTDDLKAQLNSGVISTRGSADLGTEGLNVHATAVFSKSYTEQVGGSAIAGYLNSALANREGELVVPAIITGTFANPHFAVDTEQMAQMKLKGLLPTSDNPAGALSGILGSITGQKSPTPGQAPTPQKPADTLNQVLGNILGGKKK